MESKGKMECKVGLKKKVVKEHVVVAKGM